VIALVEQISMQALQPTISERLVRAKVLAIGEIARLLELAHGLAQLEDALEGAAARPAPRSSPCGGWRIAKRGGLERSRMRSKRAGVAAGVGGRSAPCRPASVAVNSPRKPVNASMRPIHDVYAFESDRAPSTVTCREPASASAHACARSASSPATMSRLPRER
jgi:hypothetical protein